jgi:polyhydroxyalkanoate synthase
MGPASVDSDEARRRFEELNRRLVAGMTAPLDFQGWPGTPEILQSLAAGLAQDRERWLELQRGYYERQLALWQQFVHQPPLEPASAEAPADRRFAAPEWRSLPWFQYLVQSYLLAGQWLMEVVDGVKLEAHAQRKLEFMARQLVDAMSPANFPWSNPEALRLAAESGGESVARGMRHLADDTARGMISMSDEAAFEIGRNLAVTPGAIVFENELMQLIQYRPATDTVFERPLVMIPPFINKYYVLDLQPENSLVRFAVGQGHTVFMVSWRNVPPELGRITWDDYLERGVIRAIDAAAAICGTETVNTLGFCVGGTLLGSAAAVLRAKGSDRIAAVTLLASMLDFSDTGELGLFVDEAFVRKREHDFAAGGVLHGRELAITFASLRANDLIWHYVVNNYLKGQQPPPFDLLYWNADSTNLPGAMYTYYLRNMYLENNLKTPGRLTMCGVPVDLGRIDAPAYVLATREDHIVPWKTAYASARLLKGRIEFVLAASGHIAGVINPASKNRRSFWLNAALPEDAEAWLRGAASRSGSWWTHWSAWLEPFAGKRVPARQEAGGAGYRELAPAPGNYVKEKCGERTF